MWRETRRILNVIFILFHFKQFKSDKQWDKGVQVRGHRCRSQCHQCHSSVSFSLFHSSVPVTVSLFYLHFLLDVIGKEMKWGVGDVWDELLWAGRATEGRSHLRARWNRDWGFALGKQRCQHRHWLDTDLRHLLTFSFLCFCSGTIWLVANIVECLIRVTLK